MQRLLTCILLLTLLIAACTGGGDEATIAVLERAESFLPASPDSTEACLDSLGDGWTRLGSDDRALYGLLRTMTDDMLRGITPTDSIIRHTYIYYKEQMDGKVFFLQSNTLKRRYARSAFYLGRCLEQSDSIKAAEDLYREAAEYSEQAEDWHTCYLACYYLGRSVSYSNQNNGLSILSQALSNYDKCNDSPLNKIYILRELSTAQIGVEQYDSALIYAQMAFDVSRQNQSEEYISEAARALSQAYMYSGNYTEALNYAKHSVQSPQHATPFMLYNLANCYFACDSISQSRQLYDALRNDSDDYIRYVSYDMLSKIALLENNTQQAGEYFDSTKQVLESMYYKTQQQKADYYDDNVLQELQNEQLKLHNQKLVLVCAIIILVLALLAVIFYRAAHKKIALISEQRRLSKMSYDVAVKQIHLLELDINNLKLHISDLEEKYGNVIYTTKQECEQYKQQYESLLSQSRKDTDKPSETLDSLNERLKKSEYDLANLQSMYDKERNQYKQHLRETMSKLNLVRNYTISKSSIYQQITSKEFTKSQMSESQWESLELLLDTCSDNFAIRLRQQFPDMSDECYHICMLNRIGFSRMQIASFMCIAEVTVKKRHKEYKAKLFNSTNPMDNFCDLIAGF